MRAIDADALNKKYKKRKRLFCKNQIEFHMLSDKDKARVDELDNCIADVVNMPTIEQERKTEKWIPCSEKLPEDEYVLISKKPQKYIGGDRWCVSIAIRIADPRSGKIQWRDSGFGVIQDDKVLAWMPLPEPYKEGEQNED